MTEFSQDPSHVSTESAFYSGDSVVQRDALANPGHYESNIELLQSKGELGQLFAVLYEAAVVQEPQLSDVIVHATGSENDPVLSETGGHARHAGLTASGQYEISVNTDDGIEHYAKLFETRKQSVLGSAAKVGIDADVFDPKALAGFIFLHELGHIDDYMRNVPNLADHIERRKKEMSTLPIPGLSPVSLTKLLLTPKGQQWFMKAAPALEVNFGVSSPSQLLSLQDEKYRSLPTEDGPDRFAARILKPFL